MAHTIKDNGGRRKHCGALLGDSFSSAGPLKWVSPSGLGKWRMWAGSSRILLLPACN